MAFILKNISAVAASRQLGISGVGLQQTIENLSTSERIDQASDEAGLAIRNKLGAGIRIASQARRNAKDAMGYLDVAYIVLSEVRNLLARAAELSQEAQKDTINEGRRATLNADFQDIIKTIADIGQNTKFNGVNVFGVSLSVSVGDLGDMKISVGSINSDDSTTLGFTAGAAALTSPEKALSAADAITLALRSVIETRASLSASMKRLTAVSNTLGIQVESLTAASKQIQGASAVDEVVNLIKWHNLHLSGTSVLTEANRVNQLQQELLSLIQE